MSDAELAIELADLREALVRLIDAATSQLGTSVQLGADHYWTVDAAEAFSLAGEPSLQAGQLSDDVSTVRELLARENKEIFLWHDLEHVIGILQRLSSLARPS